MLVQQIHFEHLKKLLIAMSALQMLVSHPHSLLSSFCLGEPHAGREAIAPSIIRKVKVIQRGEEMPLNGGILLSQNVHVKPLSSEI